MNNNTSEVKSLYNSEIKLFKELYDDNDINWRRGLCTKIINPQIIEELSRNPDHQVRRGIAWYNSTPPHILEQLVEFGLNKLESADDITIISKLYFVCNSN